MIFPMRNENGKANSVEEKENTRKKLQINGFCDITLWEIGTKSNLWGILDEVECNKPECFGRGHDNARSFLCEFSKFDAIFLSPSPCESFQIFLLFAFANFPSFCSQLPPAFALLSLLPLLRFVFSSL
jgi:hypothetical protein